MGLKDAKEWRGAIKEELKSLSKHTTWDIVYVPGSAKVLQIVFVFKRKMNEDGTVTRYKAI